MDFRFALSQLKAQEHNLRSQGVCGLYLFGSQARNEATAGSDIDLMFDISPDVRFSLFDQARITRQLSDVLQTQVDFVPRRSLHPLVRVKAESERIMVFG